MANLNFYVLKSDLNDEEKRCNAVSYQRIIKRYVGDMVLCNNIPEADYSVYDNMSRDWYDDGTDDIDQDGQYLEIYQWYLCNLNEDDIKMLNHYGVITSYSDLLDCDVICVDHWGTSWDYVMTDAIPCEDYNECPKPWEL